MARRICSDRSNKFIILAMFANRIRVIFAAAYVSSLVGLTAQDATRRAIAVYIDDDGLLLSGVPPRCDEIASLLSNKYGDEVTRAFEHFDVRAHRFLQVYVNRARTRGLVVFDGDKLSVKCKIAGIDVPDTTKLFTPEKLPLRAHCPDGVHPERDAEGAVRMEYGTVGHWFERPANRKIEIVLSSDQAKYLMVWEPTQGYPVVTVVNQD